MEGSEGSRGTRGGLAAPSEEEEEVEGEEERGEGEGAQRLLGEEGEKTLSLLGLLRIREQIKQHLMEYNTAVNANEESIPDQVIDEKIMECSIEDLERELDDVKISYQNKTLALQRIQVADALRKKLKNEDEDSKFIWDTMKHTIMLSTAILKSHQQSRELEEKLNEVKQSRLALKQAGECKLAQIQDIKRKRKEELENMEVGEMLKKVRRNLQKEIQMTTLIQNIFQNLITGSGVNWAEDPDLKAVVLQLEKNVAGF
ncbi:centromere protein H [Sceloporus undulatus]|uniref:centromere protein H n=1 Tax=Sceloporus undulatus TaxID=8520 RepID=UPI001C4B7B5D|nr:centromere protein H [Sceloporus undulatus]